MSENALTAADVQRLLEDPSAASRGEIATKVGRSLDAALNNAERGLAEQILLILARDAAIQVRAALARSVERSAHVPRDVAFALARDVEQVSLPLLRFSQSLTEEDLLTLVANTTDEGRLAMAGRSTVSSRLSARLVELGNEATVVRLMANDGAEMEADAHSHALDRFGSKPTVPDAMAARRSLSPAVAERLVQLVSDAVRTHLVEHHAMSPDVAAELVLEIRDRALKNMIGDQVESATAVATRLQKGGTLTAPLILRALCLGDAAFFEASLAVLSGIPLMNAQKLLYEGGKPGFTGLYDRSGLAAEQLPLFQAAFEVARETDFEGEEDAFEQRRRRVIERVLTAHEGDDAPAAADWLIAKLEALKAPAHGV
ncbi:MAG: hypothetical protein JWM77_2107 [Rhodospirillales bacterium]|nr:hypothetical protein [Rhodospirillales bacterium]